MTLYVGIAQANLSPILMKNFKKFEDSFPCDVLISSGHRTPFKNKSVGGSDNSYHLKGEALDIIFPNCSITMEEAGKIAKSYFTGVIVYPRHIHVDIRKTKYYGKGKY